MKGEKLNMNIQNEEKRPVRFKPMLLAVCVIAVMLVSMVVPAFAVELATEFAPVPSVTPVDTLPYPTAAPVPDNLPSLIVEDPNISYFCMQLAYNASSAFFCVGVDEDTQFSVGLSSNLAQMYATWSNASFCYRSSNGIDWYEDELSLTMSKALFSIISSNVDIPKGDRWDSGYLYVAPPPPDLGQEVTGVLPTVLSWIQQTLNALFVEGGALSGLLLLVAVPVAITLLFLAARFIRSMIWGA